MCMKCMNMLAGKTSLVVTFITEGLDTVQMYLSSAVLINKSFSSIPCPLNYTSVKSPIFIKGYLYINILFYLIIYDFIIVFHSCTVFYFTLICFSCFLQVEPAGFVTMEAGIINGVQGGFVFSVVVHSLMHLHYR